MAQNHLAPPGLILHCLSRLPCLACSVPPLIDELKSTELTHIKYCCEVSKPTEPLFTLIINNLAYAQDFVSIENIMENLKREKACRLSGDFFQNVVKNMGTSEVESDGRSRPLFMTGHETWPGVKTFNVVLSLLMNNKLFDVVHEVYVKAPDLGIENEAYTLDILVKGLCENGKLEFTFQLLDGFPKQR
ncbi:putative Anter-specific proline-rich protein APG [Hibiscus syriacus]|uniref:Anter-specific proline-rich protein APG n=1 Tax=Hibiscus syriacus TaxID=106335 RepID=A0A6A3AN05_HIBSY|nr:pentatricopeptide repeat-containing protein At3g14580, mitochondrial-like [Hibiscus syriacus]KAE8704212.1 putative Anter-specific proline-rich protein APG [Hibiscus syriacus]